MKTQDKIKFNDVRDNKLYESLFTKKVYFTESQTKYIANKLNEGKYYINPEKVLLISKYLDKNFVRASMPVISDEGYPSNVRIVGMKGTDGKVVKNMTAKQLFYLLQDKFSGIYADKKKRNSIIKQTMIDWYNKKISKEGLLSKQYIGK